MVPGTWQALNKYLFVEKKKKKKKNQISTNAFRCVCPHTHTHDFLTPEMFNTHFNRKLKI